jgi:transporter family-2 protein
VSRATLSLVAAVLCGALVALQQRVNGELGTSLHDPLLAAVVSFGSGLLILSLLVARRGAGALAGLAAVPWWSRMGGLGGASLVAVGATTAPKIGVALLTVGLVSGTTVAALAVDRAGLAPGGARPITGARLAGAGLCLVAIALSAREGLRAVSPLLLLLVVLAGALVAVQQALNSRMRGATDALVATFVNFSVGTAALVLGFVLKAALGAAHAEHWPRQPWLYLGGAMGCVFIAVAAVSVHTVGVLRFGLATTAGQLFGGLVLDLDRGVALTTVAATVLTMAAVVVSGRRQPVPA